MMMTHTDDFDDTMIPMIMTHTDDVDDTDDGVDVDDNTRIMKLSL